MEGFVAINDSENICIGPFGSKGQAVEAVLKRIAEDGVGDACEIEEASNMVGDWTVYELEGER